MTTLRIEHAISRPACGGLPSAARSTIRTT